MAPCTDFRGILHENNPRRFVGGIWRDDRYDDHTKDGEKKEEEITSWNPEKRVLNVGHEPGTKSLSAAVRLLGTYPFTREILGLEINSSYISRAKVRESSYL